MVGEGGGEIDILGGNRTCTCTYVAYESKKKGYVAGSNHKSFTLQEVEHTLYYLRYGGIIKVERNY